MALHWRRAIVLALSGAMALPGGGCASHDAASGADASISSGGASADGGTLSSKAQLARKRLPNTDNGLEIRKLLLTPEQSIKLIAALDARCNEQESALPVDVGTRLEQNGWRFERVPTAQIDAMVTDLGALSVDMREWHGQAPDWRPLQERAIGSTPRAVAVDGRIGRYDRGAFALMIRAWTVQTETGPFMYMETLPWYHSPRGTDYRRLMGEQGSASGQPLGSMGMDLMLDSDFGYVLIGQSPADEQAAKAMASPMNSARKKPPVGPTGDEGEEAVKTMTIGEFLMTTERKPPMRVVFVFMPKIGADLNPAELAAHSKTGKHG